MESQMPVFIPPKKRAPTKSRNTSTAGQSVFRRIHSYDIVTRLPSDDRASPIDRLSSISSEATSTFELEGVGDTFNVVSTCQPNTAKTREENDNVESIEVTCTEGKVVQHDREGVSDTTCNEKSALNGTQDSMDANYLTLTGTFKRGKKAGQSVNVKLNMSREELDELEADLSKKLEPKEAKWGGVHVLALSIFFTPFVFLVSMAYAFYLGTYTWYNVYLHFSEDLTVWHRILVCPVLVLIYPFWVAPTSVAVGFYAAMVQVSWYYDCWLSEVQDLEKGFYGWLCATLHLVECAPYEVIILNELPTEKEKIKINQADTSV